MSAIYLAYYIAQPHCPDNCCLRKQLLAICHHMLSHTPVLAFTHGESSAATKRPPPAAKGPYQERKDIIMSVHTFE
eukprot:scaffold63457_cov39-Attheya_sp.AAC.2